MRPGGVPGMRAETPPLTDKDLDEIEHTLSKPKSHGSRAAELANGVRRLLAAVRRLRDLGSTVAADKRGAEIAALRQLLLAVAPLVWAFEEEASPLDPKTREKWERWEREA